MRRVRDDPASVPTLASSISAAAPAICCWRSKPNAAAPSGQRFLPSHADGRRTARSRAAASSRACSNRTRFGIPVRDASLDLITVAFGFRNLANYAHGLAEMRRVLRPGGMAAILEFSQPPNPLFAALYNFYSRRILPRDRRRDLRLARCLHLPAGIGAQVPFGRRTGSKHGGGSLFRRYLRAPDGRDRVFARRPRLIRPRENRLP